MKEKIFLCMCLGMENVAVFVNNFVTSFNCMCADNFASFNEYMLCEKNLYGLPIGNVHGAKRW